MKDRLEERLQKLQAEFQAGQKMLADLDAQRQSLTTTLLRIEGAMQVLRELLQQPGDPPRESADPTPAGG